MDNRLTKVEERIDAVEIDLQKLRKTVHDVKNEQQVMSIQMTQLITNTDAMVSFIQGTDKVFGFCRAHWKTILKFGCGFVTAYGVTNPSVQRTLLFVQHFFGI